MATAKKKPAKRRSSAQVAAGNKLKSKMAEAKRIHEKHPGKKWTTCVKEAWKK